MSTTHRNLLAAILLMLVSSTSLASVQGNPVKIRFVGTPPAIVPFEPYSGTIELIAAEDLALEAVELAGQGLVLGAMEKMAPPTLKAGQAEQLSFSGVPSGRDPVLLVKYRFSGHDFEVPVDLAAVRNEWETGGVAYLDSDNPEGAEPLRWPTPRQPAAGVDPGAEDDGPGDGAGEIDKTAAGGRTITLVGRLRYQREDGEWIYPEGIPVDAWDSDTTYDDHLAGGKTASDGTFSLTFTWDPCWVCEDNPDIYVEFALADNKIDVQTDWLERTYAFSSYVLPDFKGTYHAFGTLTANENKFLVNVFLNLRRAFDRFYFAGYNMDTIDVQYPGISSYYDPYWEEIHLEEARRWQEPSYFHELGHHWSNHYADFFNPLAVYCNGNCDHASFAPLCTHCKWCSEMAIVAELESTAHFISWLTCTVVGSVYSPAPGYDPELERIANCWDTVDNVACDCDPEHTEGFMAAFLVDLADDANENDPATPGFSDVLSLNGWDILAIEDDHQPSTITAWWSELKTRFPSIVPEMWETARNNAFDFDTAAPSNVTGLTSESHVVNVASPDATITVEWNASTDDASGIAGYAWSITSSPSNPGTLVDTPYTRIHHDPRAPGSYYFNVRAVDRAGKPSPNYTSLGPLVIREPYLSDLHLETSASWPLSVVATTDFYSGSTGPTLSPTLIGWDATYWHYQGRNDGESTIPETMINRVLIDGESLGSMQLGGGSPDMLFGFLNLGPIGVPGGRHCMAVELDATEVVPELNESNNISGNQFVWSPIPLVANSPRNFGAPRRRDAGWDGVAVMAYNADGYRFTGSGWWNALYAFTWSDTSNYDLRLHQPSSGSTDGYSVHQGWSSRPAGLLDAVLVNQNTAGYQNWDVGVLNDADGGSGFTMRHVVSTGIAMGGSQTVNWGAEEMMAIVEFRVTDTLDPPSIVVTAPAGSAPLHLAWFDENFVTGDLLDGRANAVSGTDGIARLDIDVERTGYHAAVVWRDPADGFGARSFTVSVFPTPPDLVPFTATDWAAPLVPRSYYASTPFSVSAPDTLYGNTFLPPPATYYCVCANNLGPMDAANVQSRILLDGVESMTYEWAALLSGIPEKRFFTNAKSVRGGRHTLSLVLDDPASTNEIDESNNVFGAQWVWSPLAMSYSNNGYRMAPPDPYGGLETVVQSGTVIHPNCDGLRIPYPSRAIAPGTWQAIVAMPGDTSNVDVYLHEAEAGTVNGFGTALAVSYWGPGQIDYVLIDNGLTPRRIFDVGIRNSGGAQGYHYRAINSANLGADPSGVKGPYGLGQVEYLDLYEFTLSAGNHRISLRNLTGELDYGIALYRSGWLDGSRAYQPRSYTVPYGHSWLNGSGQDEEIVVTVETSGRYCLAVYKPSTAEVQDAGEYELFFGTELSAVPDPELPSRAQIVSIYPNPFNPQTSVVFEVTRGGSASLDIYDVRGRQVRSLSIATPTPGRYEVEWNGLDQAGRAVASGNYFMRLSSEGNVVDINKAVLIR